jgi:hypothetical protein
MGFGQSNADVHDAGPRLAIEIEDAMPIFMPNDGKMLRGHMGNTPEIPPSRASTIFPPLPPQCSPYWWQRLHAYCTI